ncbi:MAG: tripartite tricarboxylate transporter substrate binding protein [Alphaproteobacteria bacterium]|nr:tripartite tricarboxylate transporter substrate binding protein [Alphaproteobacteria bacterium]
MKLSCAGKSRPVWASALVVAMLSLAAGSPASAQDYPTRPVRIVVPLAAGGPTDVTARRIGAALQERLGQPVVIENRTGAGASIGIEFVARSQPDGYTLLMGTPFLAIGESIQRDLPYNRKRDLLPVALVERGTLVLVVSPSVPAKNVAELVSHAKTIPGKLSYASVGHGTISHMTMELFKSVAGLDILNIPYRGTGPAMQAVIAGDVHMTVDALTTAGGHIDGGKVRAVAVTAGRRAAARPDIPTIAEGGYPGFDATFWAGLLVPAGTPGEIVNRLNRETRAALATPEMQQWFARIGTEAGNTSPAEFARFIDDQAVRYAMAAKAAGIQPKE